MAAGPGTVARRSGVILVCRPWQLHATSQSFPFPDPPGPLAGPSAVKPQSSPTCGAMLNFGNGMPRGKLSAARAGPPSRSQAGPGRPGGPPGLPRRGGTRTTATQGQAPAATARKPAKTLQKKNHQGKGLPQPAPVHPGPGPPAARPLHVASVCTGLATETLVLKHLLKRDLTHEFMCDKDDNVQKLLKANFPGTRILADATGPGLLEPAKSPVDVLVSGFPCQPYSRQGKRLGAGDRRADALEAILRWIRRNLPILVVLENVVGLLDKKNRPTRQKIAMALKDDYIVNWKVLKSSDFGLPQARRRWYLVARLKRAASGKNFKMPTKSGKQCPPLSKFLRAVGGPASSPLLCKTARRNYRSALARHALTPETAKKVDLVIDLGASRSRESSMLGMAPTITASRASSRSYFLTSAQRRALSGCYDNQSQT